MKRVTFLLITRVKHNSFNTCMNTKLTLTLDKEVITAAKRFAAQEGRSLSEMVENYFMLLTGQPRSVNETPLSPRIQRLKGLAKHVEINDDQKALEEALEEKYGIE